MSNLKIYEKSVNGIIKQELTTYRVKDDGLLVIETVTRDFRTLGSDNYDDSFQTTPISTRKADEALSV